MKLSARQASIQFGKSVNTITKDIKDGTLSAEKDTTGYKIDVSELIRVYGEPAKSDTIERHSVTPSDTIEKESVTLSDTVRNDTPCPVCKEKDQVIELLKEQLDYRDKIILDYQKRLDHSQLLLETDKPKNTTGLLSRLFNRL